MEVVWKYIDNSNDTDRKIRDRKLEVIIFLAEEQEIRKQRRVIRLYSR